MQNIISVDGKFSKSLSHAWRDRQKGVFNFCFKRAPNNHLNLA